MKFTAYGRDRAAVEGPAPEHPIGGASAHVEACKRDTGMEILLTGTDFNGKPFRTHAYSVSGAWAKMLAAPALSRAWHIRQDKSRRLLLKR